MSREVSSATAYAKAHDAAFRAGLKVTRFQERKRGLLREWEAKIKEATREHGEALEAESKAKQTHDGTTAETPTTEGA